jgi:uracil-DNA glycosylase family 4
MEKAPLAKCDDCPLKEQPVVQGHGPDQAELVVVGEAPGREEARSGVPFIGKAGRLLDRVLTHHGFDRGETYVTNAVLCRPPGNDTPNAKAIKCCRDRLVAEVKARRPQTVIALGAVAGKTLLNSREGITHLRLGGKRHSEELETDVVPTFHTAAALRDPNKFPSIIADVKKVKQAIGVGWEHTQYEVAESPEHAVRELQRHGMSPDWSIDAEWVAGTHNTTPEWLCASVSWTPGSSFVFPREVMNDNGFRHIFGQILADKDKRFIWQNGKSDIQCFWRSFAPEAHVTEDTMLMHYSTDERVGTHDLEQLVVEVLGGPFYKREFREAIGEDHIWTIESYEKHRDIVHRYNATDSDGTHRLVEPLRKEMQGDGVDEMYQTLLIPGANALAQVEYEGIRIDLEHLAKVEEQVQTSHDELEEATHEYVANPRSPQQIKKKLAELGYIVPDTTKDMLKGIDHPFVDTLREYKREHKMLSTYVRGLRKHLVGDRIHTTFTLHGTETGRLSSRRPNLQNQPIDHPVRESFVADDEDSVLIETDYQQIELRIAADLANDPWLLEQFHAGRHIHKESALSLFGKDYSAQDYVKTKSVAYGTLFGEQANHLAARLRIRVSEAQALIDAFFKRSPNLLDWRKDIEQQLIENSYLTSAFGRKRRFWLITQDNKKDILKEAYNFPISSPASDITLTALIALVAQGIVPRITIHDALVVPARKADAEEVARVVVRTMEESNPFDVPIPVDTKAHYRWQMKKGGE